MGTILKMKMRLMPGQDSADETYRQATRMTMPLISYGGGTSVNHFATFFQYKGLSEMTLPALLYYVLIGEGRSADEPS